MNRILTLCLAVLLGLPSLKAQDLVGKVDSIYRHLLANPSDTAALNNLNNTCNNLYNTNPDTVLFYSREQVRIANEAGHTQLEARGYNMWGICIEMQGRLDSAITLYTKAMELAEANDEKVLLIDIYNNLGIVYSYKGLFESSIEYTLKGMEIAQELNDLRRQAMMLNNLGLRYSELRNQPQAIRYYRDAVALNTLRQDSVRLATNFQNLGRTYNILEQQDSALVYYSLALALSKKAEMVFDVVACYSGMAMSYLKDSNFPLAQSYNDSARSYAESIHDEYGVKEATMVQGYIHYKRGEFAKAVPLLEDALAYFEGLKYMVTANDILATLAHAYDSLGQSKRAYDVMRQYAFGKDSLYNSEKDRAMEQVTLFRQAKQDREKELLNQEIALRDKNVAFQKTLRNTFIVIGVLLLLILGGLAHRYRYEKRTKKVLADKNAIIEQEKARSDQLLLNILPTEVAEELKLNGRAEARDFDQVTVLFTDFAEFTRTTQEFTAKQLVEELNTCFKAFDNIIEKYRIEKIKTIGDSYMAAGGLHTPRTSDPKDVVEAALEMQQFIMAHNEDRTSRGLPAFEMRVGIHTGPVVAGIVGVKKFQYDIWGDTVNTASRMESACEVNHVNISEATYELVKENPDFTYERRGRIDVKGKGEMMMVYVKKTAVGNSEY